MDGLPETARRIAFFGGSFDPPHFGHLAIARAARSALSLDAVLFAPVGMQALKPAGSTAAFADRVAMTRLAIAGEPGFSVSLADAPTASGAPNYTLETLLGLRAEFPAAALFCLMGADSFLNLSHWHRAVEIPFAATLIVVSRPDESLGDLAAALPEGLALEPATDGQGGRLGGDVEVKCFRLRNLAGEQASLYLLPELHVEISATKIRKQPQSSLRSELLPPAVAEYIESHGLYR